jgi:O-antigen ligase
MNFTEIIFTGGFLFVPLLLALGGVLFIASLVHVEKFFGTWFDVAIIPAIALGICVSSLLSGRSLQDAAIDLNLNTEGLSAAGSMILRAITVLVLGICIARICGQWLRRQKTQPQWGRALYIGFLLVFMSHNILSSAFGTQPAFIHNLFYPVVVFTAVFASRGEPLAPAIEFAKLSLYAMMVLSLVAAVIKPDFALQPGYKGWVPGISVRLWGVGSNANSIGPLALVTLLLEYMQPTKRKWIRWTAVTSTLFVFILAQSKTVWAASILLIPVMVWYRIDKPKKGLDLRVVFALILGLIVILLGVLVFDPISLWEKIAGTRAGADIETFSGRGQIWSIAINEWLKSPAFGYGPEIWGVEFRQRIGLQFATSAHNQFLQSASSAGALGLASLLVYMSLLCAAALRGAKPTRGVTTALFTLILFRAMTETPFTLSTIFNGDLLTHILFFMLCIHTGAKAKSKPLHGPARSFAPPPYGR